MSTIDLNTVAADETSVTVTATVGGTTFERTYTWSDDDGFTCESDDVPAGISTLLDEQASHGDRGKARMVTDLVLVERMPEHLRSSHIAAGNWGVYPHNGAERSLMPRRRAVAELEPGDTYDRIVRDALPSDLVDYEMAVDA